MTKTAIIGLRPMHERPNAGRKIIVCMRDGTQLECTATRVIMWPEGKDGIVIYHKRKSINESLAKGWWYSHTGELKSAEVIK